MIENSILPTKNAQEFYQFESLIDKIQASIQLYKNGIYPPEILAYKMGEFTRKMYEEVNSYDS